MIATVAIVYIKGLHIGVRVRSHIGWEYLLVFQVFLQRDAARHNGCELNVSHRAGAGVASKVFFDDFLSNSANTSDKACDGCGVEDRFDELVVRHGVSIHRVFKIRHRHRFRLRLRPPSTEAAAAAVAAALAASLSSFQKGPWP